MGAEDLGKKLLAEVEEVGLDEILNGLRSDEDSSAISHFGLPALDGLIQTFTKAKSATGHTQPMAPIIELMSTSSGDGKTHLIYHLTANAVLPTGLGGRQASVVVIDADGKFSVPRLAQQMAHLCQSRSKSMNDPQACNEVIVTSLKHVHIFSPQSMVSMVATMQSLQSYLFNASRHHSFDRAVAFIAIDSASAFYWQAKADMETAALLSKQTPSPTANVQLAAALKNASRVLSTPVVFTCWHLGSNKKSSSFGPDLPSCRPSLPPPWPTLPTLRLIVRRLPVRRLPVEISMEEALRESEMRQSVVDQGRFECVVNEWNLDEQILQRFRTEGSGFLFYIRTTGVQFGEEER